MFPTVCRARQASQSLALQRRRVLLESARLLRGVLRQALLRCFSGALHRWRQVAEKLLAKCWEVLESHTGWCPPVMFVGL